eukprot:m.115447 g.115447  ORF g.115447 m.115447 type:complete len:2902 (-) comp28424_c0_seq1:138-8843(-)
MELGKMRTPIAQLIRWHDDGFDGCDNAIAPRGNTHLRRQQLLSAKMSFAAYYVTLSILLAALTASASALGKFVCVEEAGPAQTSFVVFETFNSTECNLVADSLSELAAICLEDTGTAATTYSCGGVVGNILADTAAAGCDAAQPGLNVIVANIESLVDNTDIACKTEGIQSGLITVSTATCAATVSSLDAALAGYHNGSFGECALTTPTSTATTSVTTSATTTATSTVTTTPFFAALTCVESQGVGYLAANGVCTKQVELFNSIIEVCTGTMGTLVCAGSSIKDSSCPAGLQAESHTDLEHVLAQYPTTEFDDAEVMCNIGGWVSLRVPSLVGSQSTIQQCETAAAILNDAGDSFLDGTFAECAITTPTTTVTTSHTTSQTTSATTTATTTTLAPTFSPTTSPTISPSVSPTRSPTTAPSVSPSTPNPTTTPTQSPTTQSPTIAPTLSPSGSFPTASPTTSPTTTSPSVSPSISPTTSHPTMAPTMPPTTSIPSISPSLFPTTTNPTLSPTISPSTSSPTRSPSLHPTSSPTTSLPTQSPTWSPTTSNPSNHPTAQPSSSSPSVVPTSSSPSVSPSHFPTVSSPTWSPTLTPLTSHPSASPTISPSVSPTTSSPSTSPSHSPTVSPTISPTSSPTHSAPTTSPSLSPTTTPTNSPSVSPSTSPSTSQPSISPTLSPTGTTTATTTQTTTPFSGKLVCHLLEGDNYLGVPNDVNCEAYARSLSGLVQDCLGASVDFQCTTLRSATVLIVETCSQVSQLNAVVKGYTVGHSDGTLHCALPTFVVDDQDCFSTATLNRAIESALEDGTSACARTTVTTSQTTSATSTVTSSVTSTATTTATSTRTSTVTTSITSTGTSTATSTQTTTPGNGRFACVKIQSVEYLAAPLQNCFKQATLLASMLGDCAERGGLGDASSYPQLKCDTSASTSATHGLVQFIDDGSFARGCEGIANDVETLMRRFEYPHIPLDVDVDADELPPDLRCAIGGLLWVNSTTETASCTRITDVLNEALDSSLSQQFVGCSISTVTTTQTTSASSSQTTSATTSATTSGTSTVTTSATTSSTTSATTTATSTATTTAIYGKYSCLQLEGSGINYLAVDTSDTLHCEVQTAMLSDLLKVCDEGFGDTVSCTAVEGVTDALVLVSDDCSTTAAALKRTVDEYSRGTSSDPIGCTLGGFLKAGSACEATVAFLNSALDSFSDGTFAECEMTTMTSTATTSATSTGTTTATSTATTSGTSTITTSATSTATTTATTTATSTATTTPFEATFGCIDNLYFAIPASIKCDNRVNFFESLLQDCNSQSGNLQCDKVVDGYSPIADKGLQCSQTSSALTKLITVYSRFDSAVADVRCTAGGVLKIESCDAIVPIINLAFELYENGGLRNCEMPTFSPTSATPTTSPSRPPTSSTPTTQPTQQPSTSIPSLSPSQSPTTKRPTLSPTTTPTSAAPSSTPTSLPTTSAPTKSPTVSPTNFPTVSAPTVTPTTSPLTSPPVPTPSPTTSPIGPPTTTPTSYPSTPPTTSPSRSPTTTPTLQPSLTPSHSPTGSPVLAPTTNVPSPAPTRQPSTLPSLTPTMQPNAAPTSLPTSVPSTVPSHSPTSSPSCGEDIFETRVCSTDDLCCDFNPFVAYLIKTNCAATCCLRTCSPTQSPTASPSGGFPTISPTLSPTPPSQAPTTSLPTASPTTSTPTTSPTSSHPTTTPSKFPSVSPTTSMPTVSPTTAAPSGAPISPSPTTSPSTTGPSMSPSSSSPTVSPTTSNPTESPTAVPSGSVPTNAPTHSPSSSPLSSRPTSTPTRAPTLPSPTQSPSTLTPSSEPSSIPTANPVSSGPSVSPTLTPTSSQPTVTPTLLPTSSPTSAAPTSTPTLVPTIHPTTLPTSTPTTPSPTFDPTVSPMTSVPSSSPTLASAAPSRSPSKPPSTSTPSSSPTRFPSQTPTSNAPSTSPSVSPTLGPSVSPSLAPTTSLPTKVPDPEDCEFLECTSKFILIICAIKCEGVSLTPTIAPTLHPSSSPTTASPTLSPTSALPTTSPTLSPSTSLPSLSPTLTPSTMSPTSLPSVSPTLSIPTSAPSTRPTLSTPTVGPTQAPITSIPTLLPTYSPQTSTPTASPSFAPSASAPSQSPTSQPTLSTPTSIPSTPPTPQVQSTSEILLFPDLDCGFLNQTIEADVFHTQVANVVTDICQQEGNVTCFVSQAASLCGSVLTQLAVDVAFPGDGVFVSHVLQRAIDTGAFETMMSSQGRTVGEIELFPLNMSVAVVLQGPLDPNTTLVQVKTALVEFVQANLSDYAPLITATTLRESDGDFEFVIRVTASTVADYTSIRRFGVQEREQLDDVLDEWRTVAQVTTASTTNTVTTVVPLNTNVTTITVATTVSMTTTSVQSNDATASVSGNTSTIEIVVAVLSVIVLLLIVLLILALVLRRKRANEKQRVGVLKQGSRRPSFEGFGDTRKSSSFVQNGSFQAELTSEASLKSFWETRKAVEIPEVVYDEDEKLNGEVEQLSQSPGRDRGASLRSLTNTHYYPGQSSASVQPEFWSTTPSPTTTPLSVIEQARRSPSPNFSAVPELGGVDVNDGSISPLRETPTHSPSPDLTGDWVVWSKSTQPRSGTLSESSDVTSDSAVSPAHSPPQSKKVETEEKSKQRGFMPRLNNWRKSFFNPREAEFDRRASYMSITLDDDFGTLDNGDFDLTHSPTSRGRRRSSVKSRSSVAPTPKTPTSPTSLTTPESYEMTNMSPAVIDTRPTEMQWSDHTENNPEQRWSDHVNDDDTVTATNNATTGEDEYNEELSGFNRRPSSTGDVFKSWLTSQDDTPASGVDDSNIDEYVTLFDDLSSPNLHVPDSVSPEPKVRSSIDMNRTVDATILESEEEDFEEDTTGFGAALSVLSQSPRGDDENKRASTFSESSEEGIIANLTRTML